MNTSTIGVLNELSEIEKELRKAEMYLAGQKEAVKKARQDVLWAKSALSQKEIVLNRAIDQETRDAMRVQALSEKIHQANIDATERIKEMRVRAEARRRRAQASPQELLAMIAAE